ncbi:GNAT family N-acetyltransferase [Photobacterium galatheae]|uniref:N-acetyltransferase domain-containing protein n=1 Tax=Photobacterium galatheae TaxID=1654360 RepID=A0A066RW75_9GAMM|nr:GNAT family N-acetyltransferase [Photobacterium galatheae]KDM91628.1 hypothetical protein EA58_11445 [Photobacterium galatheae]MCM0149702.1 GNAT family N-acetyltransferase [Photobacterium galatheae]
MHKDMNTPLSHQIERFVMGWSNSRRIGPVKLNQRQEGLLCSFSQPIGSTKRSHEMFIWDWASFSPEKLISEMGSKLHFVSVFDANEAAKQKLASVGYQHLTNEKLMRLDLTRLQSVNDQSVNHSSDIEIAVQPAQIDWFNQQRQQNIIQHEQFKADQVQVYFIRKENVLASWARAIQVGQTVIIDDVQTHPEFRRQGLSKQIMRLIFRDAQQNACDQVLLAASELGQRLYSHLGFEVLSEIQVFSKSEPRNH